MNYNVTRKTIIKLFYEGFTYQCLDLILLEKRHHIGSVLSKTQRKVTKCHDFSDLNLNDLEMKFKVNRKH